jgi:hypothetical protein
MLSPGNVGAALQTVIKNFTSLSNQLNHTFSHANKTGDLQDHPLFQNAFKNFSSLTNQLNESFSHVNKPGGLQNKVFRVIKLLLSLAKIAEVFFLGKFLHTSLRLQGKNGSPS